MITHRSKTIFSLPHPNLIDDVCILAEEAPDQSDSAISRLYISLLEMPAADTLASFEQPTLTIGSVYINYQAIGSLALSWLGETYHFLLNVDDPFNKLVVSKWICEQNVPLTVRHLLDDDIKLNAKVRLGAGSWCWPSVFFEGLDPMKLGATTSVLLAALSTSDKHKNGEPLLQNFVKSFLQKEFSEILDAFHSGLECIDGTSEASRVMNRARFFGRGNFHELEKYEPTRASRPSIEKTLLPSGCMQEFQDAGALYFHRYNARAVGYLVSAPDKLLSVAPYTCAAAIPCMVIRDESDFDECAANWNSLSIFNIETLDLTEQMTLVTFDDRGYTKDVVCIPQHLLDPVFSDAVEIGHLAVILCSPSRSMLIVQPFYYEFMDDLQVACVQSDNFRPHRMYDEGTLGEAAEKFGHLARNTSEAWGREITNVFPAEADTGVAPQPNSP